MEILTVKLTPLTGPEKGKNCFSAKFPFKVSAKVQDHLHANPDSAYCFINNPYNPNILENLIVPDYELIIFKKKKVSVFENTELF